MFRRRFSAIISDYFGKKISLPYPPAALKNELFATTPATTEQPSEMAAFSARKAGLHRLLLAFHFPRGDICFLSARPNRFLVVTNIILVITILAGNFVLAFKKTLFFLALCRLLKA